MNYIHYSIDNHIGVITLSRPEKRNALSFELVGELKEAFALLGDDPTVKVIILKAEGEAFCAGADLAYLQKLQEFSYEQNLADSSHLKELFLLMYTLKKVIIAQVQGHALAGGCGLAAVCDFVFAAPEAKFGYTEVRIGFIPAVVMVFLLRKVGESHAKRLLLSGELITADEAKHLSLIHHVVPREKLEAETHEFAANLIRTNSTHAMMMTKQMIAHVQSLALSEALTFAAERNAEARASDDCKRGVDAFLRKEKITW
ncbi:enoyl-CoA hydratase/isomerase family protein [Chryseolinea sp. Jin1]|uniref:Enoyl-CoA hydratase/isomerase family protein n=2 Tax=Chryseolinea lacunae TaxID=2801331 RepID=A0ABS1KKE9_9BACT|nr:enoyl-CoA hydratase-related protein [Chryseolinea lacunae]MBL0739929.1 enoyl-CoA hydratase/isomerase family protein [Chryseolinea lacunae]